MSKPKLIVKVSIIFSIFLVFWSLFNPGYSRLIAIIVAEMLVFFPSVEFQNITIYCNDFSLGSYTFFHQSLFQLELLKGTFTIDFTALSLNIIPFILFSLISLYLFNEKRWFVKCVSGVTILFIFHVGHLITAIFISQFANETINNYAASFCGLFSVSLPFFCWIALFKESFFTVISAKQEISHVCKA